MRKLDAEKQKLAANIVGLAQGVITAGTEIADPLIRGHLQSAVGHGTISPKQKDDIMTDWEVLRQQIEEQKPRGITEVSLRDLSDRLQSLHAGV